MSALSTLKNNHDLHSVIHNLTTNGYAITHVFDVGANKGRWTEAYEPALSAAHFSLFEANPKHTRPDRLAARHGWFNVVLSAPDINEVDFYSISGCKASRDGTGDSYYKEDTQVYNDCSPIKLTTSTLDDVAKRHSLQSPQLIKLDTQGSELDILRGAADILERTDIIVTEAAILPYNKGAPSFSDYINFMDGLDFVPVGLDEVHFADDMLLQADVVFLRKRVKSKYYGDNKRVKF